MAIWNISKECMSTEDRRLLHDARLKKLITRLYHHVPFYRQRLQELDLTPADITGIADINLLPFTSKDDLRDNYPYRLFAAPETEIVRLHASSGTTGKATVVGYTRRDIEVWQECVARCLTMAGVGIGDKVQVAYGYGMFTGGLGLHYGAENLGATVIPISAGNTRRQLDFMVDLGTTAIACTPSYLAHVMEHIKQNQLQDQLKLRVAICGGEPWTVEMRQKIEAGLGIELFDIYGLSEIMGPGVSQDCHVHQGSHVMDDHFYAEVVDPDTLEVLPDGEMGELVLTTLTKEGIPLLRYRTKDLTSITHEPCACGRTSARISRFKGRSDDMLIIRGVNVFPSQIEAALFEISETGPHYQILVDRVNDYDTFEIAVEIDGDLFSDEVSTLEKLSRRISDTLQNAIGLHPTVKLVEPNTLERSDGKAKRVIDKRQLY